MDSIKNWEKSDFKEVISEIVEDSDKSGYVTESKEVLIATVYENNEDDTYKATVKSEIDDVAKKYEQQNYKMEAVESDLDTRAKAQKEGISTGRYIRSHKDELEDKNKDFCTYLHIVQAQMSLSARLLMKSRFAALFR